MTTIKGEKEILKTPVFSVQEVSMTQVGKKDFSWHYLKCPSVVHTVAYNPEKDIVYVIKEFRLGCKCDVLNIISGKVDEGEDSETAAIRESEEELGFKVKKAFFLHKGLTNLGIIDELASFYVVIVGDEKSEHVPDEHEDLRSLKLSVKDFLSTEFKGLKSTLAQVLFEKWLKNN